MSWSDRKKLKRARELVAGARKLLRIHRDTLDQRRAQELASAADRLAEAVASKNVASVESLTEKLEMQFDKTFPRPPHAALRENVEVLLVAVIVAMAVRTFFIQPFKIPTGSMQPTLYGIYPAPPQVVQYENDAPSLFGKILGAILEGKIYTTEGYRMRGDHIFVDKLTYHFRAPRRGEVIVFETGDIPDIPEASRGKFYIKRLIGLPGDTVQIQPPHVLVNGQILDQRPAFQRIYSMTNGYHGYFLASPSPEYPRPKLQTKSDAYSVAPDDLFVLGDNSYSSLDGRFWGSLPKKALVGRAIIVYWPFTKRFGPID